MRFPARRAIVGAFALAAGPAAGAEPADVFAALAAGDPAVFEAASEAVAAGSGSLSADLGGGVILMLAGRFEEGLPRARRAALAWLRDQPDAGPDAVAPALLALSGDAAAYASAATLTALRERPAAEAALADARFADAPLAAAQTTLLSAFIRFLDGDLEAALVGIDAAAAALAEAGAPRLEARAALARGVTLRRLNRIDEAEAAYRAALALIETHAPPLHPDRAAIWNSLAVLLRVEGRLAEAGRAYEAALGVAEAAHGPDAAATAAVLNNLGVLYRNLGRFAEAERSLRRALSIRETAFGPDHPRTGATLNALGVALQARGRTDAAIAVLDRAEALLAAAHGPDDRRLLPTLNALAVARETAGDPEAAVALHQRALTIAGAAHDPAHPRVETARANLASALRFAGRLDEAEALARAGLDVALEARGPDHPLIATYTNNLAGILRDAGALDDAAALYRAALAQVGETFGEAHPRTAPIYHNLAKTARLAGDWDAAFMQARRAAAPLERRLAELAGARGEGAQAERRAARAVFIDIVEAAARRSPNADDRLEPAFAAIQQAGGLDVTATLARASAALAAGDGALAALLRRHERLSDERRRVDGALLDAAARPSARRDPAAEAAARARLAEIDAALDDVERDLSANHAQAAALLRPQTVALAEAQALLDPHEALIQVASGPRASFVFLLTAERVELTAAPLSADAVEALVTRLRRGLDPLTAPRHGGLEGFDTEAAEALHAALFTPFADALADKTHLFFVGDGALSALPVAVLLAEPTPAFTGPEDFATAPWFALRHAISILPGVGALRSLRAVSGASAAPEPFVGVGDPLLDGHPTGTRSGACPPAPTRAGVAASTSPGPIPELAIPELVIPGDEGALRSAEDRARAADWATAQRGVGDVGAMLRGADGLADPCVVGRMAALPETADELIALAADFGSQGDAVLLREAATEARVAKHDLSAYRNIAFATHGLIAGEIAGLEEPALVLTPPEAASLEDDGLLKASEIVALDLDADWVILSACNTAAPDGRPGAPGLSGLAQSFFQAGARALFVSHWAVVSDATAALTRDMIGRLTTTPGLTRAEAHRAAIRWMIDGADDPNWAHPLFWAPFVIVGDGGR